MPQLLNSYQTNAPHKLNYTISIQIVNCNRVQATNLNRHCMLCFVFDPKIAQLMHNLLSASLSCVPLGYPLSGNPGFLQSLHHSAPFQRTATEKEVFYFSFLLPQQIVSTSVTLQQHHSPISRVTPLSRGDLYLSNKVRQSRTAWKVEEAQ